jgi:hypothetical protein
LCSGRPFSSAARHGRLLVEGEVGSMSGILRRQEFLEHPGGFGLRELGHP